MSRTSSRLALALSLSLSLVCGVLGASAAVAQDATPAPDAHAVAARLMARHTRDLPAAWPAESTPALRWLATHHSLAVIRMRALQALAGDDSEETRALLLSVIRDERAGESLRASAVIGSGSLTLDRELRAALVAAATGHAVIAEEVARRMGTTTAGGASPTVPGERPRSTH